ncbi:MAG TPA: 2-oxoacid:ferredoxin oxidoreductase subunit gamma [Anaerolineae bacterium]|nr:2-oxoacid:ferredoxin oxidoreductase subunit gamma [Anaerolineae bacterium]
MQTEIIISGFGGQGALFIGQLLAYTGLDLKKHVTWFPSYGPEMRGGTAHCTVIISEDEIGAPVVSRPRVAIVMNLPSLDKYEPLVLPGGVLVINTSLVDRQAERTDIDVVYVPANEIAEELGEKRLANMVLLGAFLTKMPIISLDEIAESLGKHIPEHRRNLLEANLVAMKRGSALVTA